MNDWQQLAYNELVFNCLSDIHVVSGCLDNMLKERIGSLPVLNLGKYIIMKCGKAACELVPEQDRVTSLLKNNF